jgi:very-short-patch-repair endonuclease
MKDPSDDKPHPAPPLTRDRARELRRESTDPERMLWARLRKGQLLGAKFRRQHPIGPYLADFFCLKEKLVIELDGGGHDEENQRRADAIRTSYLETRGYRVLRFWNNDVTENIDGVLENIAEHLKNSALPRTGEAGAQRRVRDRSAWRDLFRARH